MKRTLKWLAVAFALSLCIIALSLFFVQPLLPSRAFKVTATLDETPVPARLFTPPAMRGIYYVHLPDAKPSRYSWFGIAFPRQSVFSPIALYTGWRGLPYIHTDQAKGVRLTSGKIEDGWNVTFSSDGVQFSNASLSIKLEQNP